MFALLFLPNSTPSVFLPTKSLPFAHQKLVISPILERIKRNLFLSFPLFPSVTALIHSQNPAQIICTLRPRFFPRSLLNHPHHSTESASISHKQLTQWPIPASSYLVAAQPVTWGMILSLKALLSLGFQDTTPSGFFSCLLDASS